MMNPVIQSALKWPSGDCNVTVWHSHSFCSFSYVVVVVEIRTTKSKLILTLRGDKDCFLNKYFL